MTDEGFVTMRWMVEIGGVREYVEMDVPSGVAAAFARGQGVVEYGEWPMRRFKEADAPDRVQAWHEAILKEVRDP
jgi:hypothetical protein